MKLLTQIGIIFGICWISTCIERVLPFTLPASIIGMLLLLALLIPAAAAAPALGGGTKFSDIQGHWAEQQIEQAVAEG